VLRIELDETWYRIPDARDSRVMRASLGRLRPFESIWEAWRDAIRVLIRVLQPGPLDRLHPDWSRMPGFPMQSVSPRPTTGCLGRRDLPQEVARLGDVGLELGEARRVSVLPPRCWRRAKAARRSTDPFRRRGRATPF